MTTLELVMTLHHELGNALQVQWCPNPNKDVAALPSGCRGLLAGVFATGQLAIFAVPFEKQVRSKLKAQGHQPLHLQMAPLLTLDLVETSMTCLDWASPSRIAAGCGNGRIAVWDLGQALEEQGADEEATPIAYWTAHEMAVTTVKWSLSPPRDALDRPKWTEQPEGLVSASLSGSLMRHDMQDLSCPADLRKGNIGEQCETRLAYSVLPSRIGLNMGL